MPGVTISVSNVFAAGTRAKASQVNANFNSIISGLSDQTKDIAIATAYFKYVGTSASHTITSTDGIRYFNATFGSTTTGSTIYLPTSSANSGRIIGIKHSGGNSYGDNNSVMTITPISGETIDGTTANYYFATRNDSAEFISDGVSGWLAVNENLQPIRANFATQSIPSTCFTIGGDTISLVGTTATLQRIIPPGQYYWEAGLMGNFNWSTAPVGDARGALQLYNDDSAAIIDSGQGMNLIMTSLPESSTGSIAIVGTGKLFMAVSTITTVSFKGFFEVDPGAGTITTAFVKDFWISLERRARL